MAKKDEIKKEPEIELPYSTEEIASGIAKIARAMKVFQESRLKRKTILVLLSHETKLPQSTIEYVLNTLEQLEEIYLKK